MPQVGHSACTCLRRVQHSPAERHACVQMDLVPDDKAKEQLHQVIFSLNASAEVHETKFCHLHLEHILGRGILHNPGANGNLLSPGGMCLRLLASGCPLRPALLESRPADAMVFLACAEGGVGLHQGTCGLTPGLLRQHAARSCVACMMFLISNTLPGDMHPDVSTSMTHQGVPSPRCAGTEGPFRAGSLGAKQALAARGFSEDAEALHTHDSGVGSVALHADSVDLDKCALAAWVHAEIALAPAGGTVALHRQSLSPAIDTAVQPGSRKADRQKGVCAAGWPAYMHRASIQQVKLGGPVQCVCAKPSHLTTSSTIRAGT